MSTLEFECLVMDMCAEEGISDPESLRRFSDTLHQSLEMAIEDYASDEGFGDDYSPVY